MIGRTASLLAALAALSACAPAKAPLPRAPVGAGAGVAVQAAPVPLNPADPAQAAIGAFRYAGGVALTSEETARLHGLSDLRIDDGGRLTAISDEGDLLRARIVLDAAGRLTGLADARISALPGLDGQPLPGKLAADAEGLAVLPNGDLLVSFEQQHRIWLYPAGGGAPRAVPAPATGFPPNGGMEALTLDPAAGADAYVAGGEESGQTFACRLGGSCVPAPPVEKPPEFGLVAMTGLPQGRTAYLLRAFDPLRGARVVLKIMGPAGEIDRLELGRPYTVDNFEGVTAVPGRGGAIRFYLLSDDNFQSIQRTLLLAFDWAPKS